MPVVTPRDQDLANRQTVGVEHQHPPLAVLGHIQVAVLIDPHRVRRRAVEAVHHRLAERGDGLRILELDAVQQPGGELGDPQGLAVGRQGNAVGDGQPGQDRHDLLAAWCHVVHAAGGFGGGALEVGEVEAALAVEHQVIHQKVPVAGDEHLRVRAVGVVDREVAAVLEVAQAGHEQPPVLVDCQPGRAQGVLWHHNTEPSLGIGLEHLAAEDFDKQQVAGAVERRPFELQALVRDLEPALGGDRRQVALGHRQRLQPGATRWVGQARQRLGGLDSRARSDKSKQQGERNQLRHDETPIVLLCRP